MELLPFTTLRRQNEGEAVKMANHYSSDLLRLLAGIDRRRRLYWTRLRHRRATFGGQCDIRSGFRLRLLNGGRLAIGRGCVLDYDLTIECEGELSVGDRTIFGHHCTLACQESLVIGEDCLIAELVSMRDHDHAFDRLDAPIRTQGVAIAPVRIGRNVWIGAKATVLRGVKIGDNTIVGANAVVTKSLPANVIAVGVPARIIRQRT
jgi:acetyltransferase-like isoleucine patch superfamily enzyme